MDSVKLIAILCIGLLINGCSDKPSAKSAEEEIAEIIANDNRDIRDGIPASVYPEAHYAKLFIDAEHIEISDSGQPSEGSYPAKGIRLTPDEMNIIQNSFTYVKPPEISAACCIPRHAFVFYDRSDNYLGHATVCFECSCAYISGSKPASDKLTDLVWDEAALEKIVKAHGQTVRFES